MNVPMIRSALEGWRPRVRLRLKILAAVAAVVFLGLMPFDGYRWFGLAVFGLACLAMGLMAFLALVDKHYARQWLDDTRPDDMTYRLLLTAVLAIGTAIALVLKSYIWLIDGV